MNSLVVLLSFVVLAAAKPSQLFDAGVLAYSAPVIAAAPAAVSTQSRLDIKTSPAIVSTAAVAPIAVRNVIAESALLAAPAAIVAPSAVSHQSRVDIKTTPAITSTVVAAAPLAYSSYSAPVVTAAFAPTIVKTAAIAPAFAAPAFIKTAGLVPSTIGLGLNTPDVVALTRAHVLRKRSAPLIATAPLLSTPVVSTYAASPIISTYGSPLTYAAPLNLGNPILTKSYGLW